MKSRNEKKIIFCKTRDPYGEFSNFYVSIMNINGIEYLSVENYYQSKKYENTEWEEYIRNQPSPYEAKREAYRKDIKEYIKFNWDEIKILVMGKALHHKFKNPVLRNLLFSTGTAELIEYSKHDYFWGRNEDGAGYNMLGKLLMELREEIRCEEHKKNKFF